MSLGEFNSSPENNNNCVAEFINNLKLKMFCCSNDRFHFYKNEAEKRDLVRRSRTIDEEIESEKITMDKTLKILLLGWLYF